MPKNNKQPSVLPTLDEIYHFRNSFSFVDDERKYFQLPAYIKQNLKHKLRNYQIEALFNLNYTQHDGNSNDKFNQLLFHMATGSGKTDEMAAIILYFYSEFNYQNFLFVVNTKAVVAKTRENLINTHSPKYLFNREIGVDNQKVLIKEVSRFPKHPEKGVIYLRLVTIQNLESEVTNPRENGLTYSDFVDQPTILLADEAHHFSSDTKNKDGNRNDRAWESVLNRIRNSNPKNRQLEFTATIDLENKNIYNKYRQKIIFQYDLFQFQSEGYSKNIFRLQANNDDKSKMMNAVLLSQFRKHIARKYDIFDFKPIILFKSNKISISKETRANFLEMIHELNSETLKNFINKQLTITNSNTLRRAYVFFQNMNMAKLVIEIKHDFGPLKTINVNDSSQTGMLEKTGDFKKLNTLEEPDNPLRAIFAVAKLSEGWDVLNLYDIVRVGEQPTSPAATNSEAQLIGRGARYYPFEFQGKRSYTRRFDNDYNDLTLLETLHYHTINDSKYIDNLKRSFDNLKLQVNDDFDFDVFKTKVKTSFKKTPVYQSGSLFINEVEDIPQNEYDGLSRYGVPIAEMPEVNIESGTTEAKLSEDLSSSQTKKIVVNMEHTLIKKALARNTFFRFNNLKTNYTPTLDSMSTFISGEKWLGKIEQILAVVPYGIEELSREQQLLVIEKYVVYIQRMLVMNFKKKRGTNKFEMIYIRDTIKDYEKKVPRAFNGTIRAKIQAFDMSKESWFVYDKAIVNGLEHDLIEMIRSFIVNLNKNFDHVYLLRNDEKNSQMKLYDFGKSVSHYGAFMPDFTLYLQNEKYIYQFYIEPKGSQLLFTNQWKEDLLSKIRPDNIEIVGQTDKVKLYGIRFYVTGDARNIREELSQILNTKMSSVNNEF